MASYDDKASIARIRQAMREDPSLTQRSAIIGKVGEDNLRRVQMKITKEDKQVSVMAPPPEAEIRKLYAYEGPIVSHTGPVIESSYTHVLILGEDGNRHYVPKPCRAWTGDILRVSWIGGACVFIQNYSNKTEEFGNPLVGYDIIVLIAWIVLSLAALGLLAFPGTRDWAANFIYFVYIPFMLLVPLMQGILAWKRRRILKIRSMQRDGIMSSAEDDRVEIVKETIST